MVTFDKHLCMEQLLTSLAYKRLFTAVSEELNNIEVERPSTSSIISILNKVYNNLVDEYKSVSDIKEIGNDFGVILSSACAENVLFYLKTARDKFEVDIYKYNRPTKARIQKSLKNLEDNACRLDFTELV